MDFKIYNLAFITLLFLLIYLIVQTNEKNKFHLNYLKLHLACLLLAISIYIAIHNKWIVSNRFDVILGVSILGISFLLLHIESAVKGYKAGFKPMYILPIVFYAGICLFNYYDIYFLQFETRQIFIKEIKVSSPMYFSDKLLFRNILVLIYVFAVFVMFKKNIQNSQDIKKRDAYSFWVYSYLSFTAIAVILSTCYYFGFFSPASDEGLIKLTNIFSVLLLLIFHINPSLLYYIPIITKVDIYQTNSYPNTFLKIEQLLKSERLFLKKELSLNEVCDRLGLQQKIITAAVKENTSGNWRSYINGYRIAYAIELIGANFLKSHSIIALSEKSGFNSNQSFFRAFKLITGTSPAKYNKKVVKDVLDI